MTVELLQINPMCKCVVLTKIITNATVQSLYVTRKDITAMTPEQLCKEVKERRDRGETYKKIASDLHISSPAARRLALGEKPGKKLSDTLDPSAKLKATRERRKKLNDIAKIGGYKNWSEYETFQIHNFNGLWDPEPE